MTDLNNNNRLDYPNVHSLSSITDRVRFAVITNQVLTTE